MTITGSGNTRPAETGLSDDLEAGIRRFCS